jgi:GNAT acetyltransferase-like protein
MTSRCRVVVDPDDRELAALAALSGGRCHYSAAFLRANDPGGRLTAFVVGQPSAPEAGAVGYERHGRLFSKLTLPTPPVITAGTDAAPLWAGLRDHCRAHRVATVSLQSFEGAGLFEPPLGVVHRRTPREEFVVDLSGDPAALLARFSENHRRNIKKAGKHGLDVAAETSDAAADAHADMFRSSMERRAARGEDVGLETDRARVRRLVAGGAGSLFQARREGQVLASLLILSTDTCAYYHSGGSASEGMKVGASHLAMWHAMETARARGVRSFCLGGASAGDSEGLTGYKLGFNPRRLALEHLVYAMDVGFPWNTLRTLLGR